MAMGGSKMNFLPLRCATVSLIILFIIFGCGGDGEPVSTENNGDIEEFIWETNGGGDILFSIIRVANEFEISVERYDFQSVDVVIILTNTDLEVYELVQDIFNENINIYDYTFTPTPEVPTGSWTTITLISSDGQELNIENIRGDDELGILYDFVAESTEQAL